MKSLRPARVAAVVAPVVAVVAAAVLAPAAAAQFAVTLPPSGGNQKAEVTQWIGLVKVNVSYSGPKVTAPDGTDRRGKIWGGLVPYGWHKESFGTCGNECPWRGGANENTVVRVSHDVTVEGKPLPAGAYGLFFVPGPEEWTVIFSKDSTSWGHYFYDAKDDALRVTVKPRKAPYTHWLTYDFVERLPEKATLAMRWEELEVPISIGVPNMKELYVANLRDELRGAAGFNGEAWDAAANYCRENKVNLPEALTWAQYAVSAPFVGRETFNTLSTLAALQEANGKAEEARATMAKAMASPTATAIDIHMYGRSLQTQGRNAEALAVFEMNAKKHPGVWPVDVGLARAYAGAGRTKEALAAARKALAQAPDDVNRENLKKMIAALEAGKPLG